MFTTVKLLIKFFDNYKIVKSYFDRIGDETKNDENY